MSGGHGPPPKPPDQRARGKRSDPVVLRVVQQAERVPQPLLPADIDWHPQVVAWWHTWRESELSRDFTTTDWLYLIETATIQNRFWKNGDMSVAAELRLRAAKFGATPEDRARLRIQVVTAHDAEAKSEAVASVPSSRANYTPPGKTG